MRIDNSESGGVCIPVVQKRNVLAQFTNIVDWESPTEPIKPLTIITDATVIPNKLKLSLILFETLYLWEKYS